MNESQANNRLILIGVGLFFWIVLRGNANSTTENELPPIVTPPIDNNYEDLANATISALGITDGVQIDSLYHIINAFRQYGDGDTNKLAYMLATAWHESRMRPIEERRAAPGTRVYELQNRYWSTGYYGRGFVQLTFESNYQKFTNLLGIDLVENPALALASDIAAKILVVGMMDGTFTGRALGRYINDNRQDFYNARRTVNGTDRADLIRNYTLDILNQWQAFN